MIWLKRVLNGIRQQDGNAKIAMITSYSTDPAALGERAIVMMTLKEQCVLVDSLQKQEGRDAQGRFLKGLPGNPEGRFRKRRSDNAD
jgi:hypothetical protein